MSVKDIRVGITMRVVTTQFYDEPRDAVAHDWWTFLAHALPDACWMPLPNVGSSNIQAYCSDWGINRLILTGGDDFGNFPLRDETEMALLNWATALKVPTLGICRGMQMMVLHAGGGLKDVPNHENQRHKIRGYSERTVNSYHRRGLKQCPRDFTVDAVADDGEIEAIARTNLPWRGWMWHPEREQPFHHEDIMQLQALFL